MRTKALCGCVSRGHAPPLGSWVLAGEHAGICCPNMIGQYGARSPSILPRAPASPSPEGVDPPRGQGVGAAPSPPRRCRADATPAVPLACGRTRRHLAASACHCLLATHLARGPWTPHGGGS
eukprot:scaffold2065_cov359-Prasinococcus_capsulatus_cf.AAC.13